MNEVTQHIINFLAAPGLPFGAEEDVLLLADPDALRVRVTELLTQHPDVLGTSTTQVKEHLGDADWPLIAQEFQTRVKVASQFFDQDAQNDSLR